MKTQIFKNYSDFLQREDKEINGVDQDFADENPNYEKQNETNRGCFNCYDCSDCYDCYDCSRCFRCYDCSRCSDCSDCSDLEDEKKEEGKGDAILIPILSNIHSKILEAASEPNALNMESWHTCDTTHCRAGWVVQLAGKEGKELEKRTSTLFAAMMIYKKSSEIRVSPPRFFETNEVAMADMKRCAEMEGS